uniref:Uncharacterized protein n=1 Tax=uncultured marine virus TaxID=186617 RepID=A0A0F7L5H2_9VIRU|nr:hypothetical protein [uncultured marine virus]
MKEIAYKFVEIPHLRVTVYFMDLTKLKGVEIQGSAYTTIFDEDENMNLNIGVFYEKIEKNVKRIECMPMIIHEIVHALQYICERRNIDMEEEKEHMGYMASYLTEKLLCL